MPYCPDRNLLFIHITKTGGKSVAYALGLPLVNRPALYAYRTLSNRVFTYLQRKTADQMSARRANNLIDTTLVGIHLSYAEIYLLEILPRHVLQNSLKFAVCRNPYDRAVSQFLHVGQEYERSPAGFERFWQEWIDADLPDHNTKALRRSQHDYCFDLAGQCAMENMIRFETLKADFDTFCRDILKEAPQTLAHMGKASRSHFSEYYTPHARALIRSYYAEDFEAFSYSTSF